MPEKLITSRTSPTPPPPVLYSDPTKFGCVMNGTTDDSSAFDTMLGAIASGASPKCILIPGGKKLYLAGGDGEIVLPPGCSIEGISLEASEIVLGSDRTISTAVDASQHGRFMNLRIRGDAVGDRNQSGLLKLGFGNKAHLQNLQVGYSDGDGIICNKLQNSTLINCQVIYAGGHGLVIEDYTLHSTFWDIQTVNCGINNTVWEHAHFSGDGTPDGEDYYGIYIRPGVGGVNPSKLLFLSGGPEDSLADFSGQLAAICVEGGNDITFQGMTAYQQINDATKRAVIVRAPSSPSFQRFTDAIVFRDCYIDSVVGDVGLEIENTTGQVNPVGVVIEGQTRIASPGSPVLVGSDNVQVVINGRQEPRVVVETGGTATKPVEYYVQQEDTPWVLASLLNSWQNYGSGFQEARYRKERDRVFIEGALKTGLTGTVAFNLPEGCRPPGTIIVPAVIMGGGFAYVIVYWNGDVTLFQASGVVGDGTWFSCSISTI